MIKCYRYGEVPNSEIFGRESLSAHVEDVVAEILAEVRCNGDKALLAYTKKFDKAELSSLEVSEEEFQEAMDQVEPEFLDILREAAANIRAYHEKQVRRDFVMSEQDGVVLGQKLTPIEKVGLYVPNGTAAYPSTVLMDAIPAKIAGCRELVMVTPPSADGKVDRNILAAARVAGIDRVFKVGGAQAVAALAYGTESVPAVYKIVGPGNAYVAEAKKQVFGKVAIDVVAGPSEVLVVADGTCDPRVVAADMLAQAEHDKMSSAVLVTDDAALAAQVAREIDRQLPLLPRQEIAGASIEKNGKIIVADNLSQAIEIANEIAPEHLELCVDDPFAYLEQVKNAGSIFLGKNSPEPLGDYMAGPNHTLPTGGIAKFASPLSVDDFVKKSQFTYYSREALKKISGKIAVFAEKEGLHGHARSARIRFEDTL
ncbi:MAG: histidinol dehydrogenase [Oscillospiraceae bacterium]|nr:histidinol dehydrogenase [Oscillospiraceae bacterium]